MRSARPEGPGTTLSDSQQLAKRGMLRDPHAGVEKRAFLIPLCDPRRSVTCAAVALQARFTCSV